MSDPAARIDELLRQVIERFGVPGVSVAIEAPGFVHRCAMGTAAINAGSAMTVDTRFSLGCITKLFTGLVALQFAAERKLDLDAPVSGYLPELDRGSADGALLVRHLASHTSGFESLSLADPKASHFFDWEKFVGFFRAAPRTFSPGSVFNYDHTEHVMLGEILKRVSGQGLDELFDEHIFEACELQNCHDRTSDKSRLAADHAAHPDAGKQRQIPSLPHGKFWEFSLARLAMSPFEIVRVVDRHVHDRANGGRSPEHSALIASETIRLPAMAGASMHEKMPSSFSLCCAHYEGGLSGHNGSTRGQTCGVRFDIENRVSIVVALNSWQPFFRDYLLARLVSVVRAGLGLQSPATQRSSLPQGTPEGLVGKYSGGVVGTEISVSAAERTLKVEISSRFSPAPVRFNVSIGPDGTFSVGEEAGHLSLAFFRDPADDKPCMMLGLNAFKKIQ